MTPSQGPHIRHPEYHIFTLQFIKGAKLKLRSNEIISWLGRHDLRKNVSALGRLKNHCSKHRTRFCKGRNTETALS